MSPVETRASPESSIPIKSLSPRSSLSVDDAIGFGTLLPGHSLSEIRISSLPARLPAGLHDRIHRVHCTQVLSS